MKCLIYIMALVLSLGAASAQTEDVTCPQGFYHCGGGICCKL